jgi:membrane protein implicated in regulation of membrane protease activity
MRKGLITIGTLVVILGAAALASGIVPGSFVVVFWGCALIAAIVFERVRYKRLEAQSPGPGWQRTTERFVDEETGAMVTVYVQPETGERAYVKE